MRLREAEEMALGLMKEHGLVDWRFVFSRREPGAMRSVLEPWPSFAGRCLYRTKIIALSRWYVRLNTPDEVKQTILHEIAHARLPPGSGHGHAWQAMARAIGYTGGVCYGSEVLQPRAPWNGICPGGHLHKRFRRPKPGIRVSCAACAPHFSDRFAIVWVRMNRIRRAKVISLAEERARRVAFAQATTEGILEQGEQLVSALRSSADILASMSTSLDRSAPQKLLLQNYALLALRFARQLDTPPRTGVLAPNDLEIVVSLLRETIKALEALVAKDLAAETRLRARTLTLRHALMVLQRGVRPSVASPEKTPAAVPRRAEENGIDTARLSGSPIGEPPRSHTSRRSPPTSPLVSAARDSRRELQPSGEHMRNHSISPGQRKPRAITLRCVASPTPIGWAAMVRFVRRGKSTEAWHSSDMSEIPLERVGRWNTHPTRRALVRWVAGNLEIANAGDFVSECRVSGLKGLWAELLILAFNHGDDGTNGLALALLALTDAELRRLRRHLGPLTSDEALEELRSLFYSLASRKLNKTALLRLMLTPAGRRRIEDFRRQLSQ
jgi:hypothetical protein